jgi:hypothetical protein
MILQDELRLPSNSYWMLIPFSVDMTVDQLGWYRFGNLMFADVLRCSTDAEAFTVIENRLQLPRSEDCALKFVEICWGNGSIFWRSS